MAVELLEKKLQVPRNVQEISDLLVGLVEDIKAKKPLAAMLSENLQPLMVAVEGIEKLGEEAKSPELYNAIALLAADLARVLLAKAPEAPAPVEPAPAA